MGYCFQCRRKHGYEALRTSSARDFGLSGEVDVFESLVKISEITELVEREKKLDALRWNWMEDAIFFDYFTIERIFAFLLKLEMIERWISLDKEREEINCSEASLNR